MSLEKLVNLYLIGPMGAGKSTIGRQLAKRLGFEFYDSDQEVEKRSGAEMSWIFDVEGEEGFRKREQKVIHDLTEHKSIVLATGGGAILYPENRTRLAARGTVVYLTASLEQQLQRTEKDKRRPLLQNVEDPKENLININTVRVPLYEEIAELTISTDAQSVSSVANNIIKALEKLEF